jgi:SAM-dependent methyltransferase
MSTSESPELRVQLADFVRYRRDHLSGDEKGEAQVFLDRLFRALGHEGIREAGATLEMRIKKHASKGIAFADLMWKPRCLIEMKKAGADLSRHYRQAFEYWIDAVPDRPRYVVLCNFDEFWIYDFNAQLDEPVDRLQLNDVPRRIDALAFLLPQPAEPTFNNDLVAVTREAASQVARVFVNLHERGIERPLAQRFVLQSVMAMFAEDIGLLPGKFFSHALDESTSSQAAYDLLLGLFREMNTPGDTPGGRYKGTPYFNGGIFASPAAIELDADEIFLLRQAASTDWSAVRPEIFGTLFEQSMDAGERHAQGAHFTNQVDIAKVVLPTIVNPWRKMLGDATTIDELEAVLAKMYNFRVLDPACGSGNFLYVAYREMRRIEHEAIQLIRDRRKSERLRTQGRFTYVTPDHFYGIDINPFAVEIAKVTMLLAKKLSADELDEGADVLPLDNLDGTIHAADALFSSWPHADAIIGNPPFLGRRKMVEELGPAYTQRLAEEYPGVRGVSDFVCYWFPLAHDHLRSGGRAGLVATKTITQNESRESSLDYIVDNGGTIIDAVASQPWSGDAVVTVSIVNWIKGETDEPKNLWLNSGELKLETDFINSSLRPNIDVRHARKLPPNLAPQTCFQGQTPGVSDYFVLDQIRRDGLVAGDASSGRYIHPFLGGRDMLERPTVDRWVIDIDNSDLISATSSAPKLMEYLNKNVLPERQKVAAKKAQKSIEILAANPNAKVNRHHENFLARWWQLDYRRTALIDRIEKMDRYIATSRVASWRRATVFSYVDSSVRPGDSLSVFTLDDDYSFGILSSSIHRTWFEARCSTLKSDLRYTSTTVWDSFPWPQTPSDRNVRDIVKIVCEILDERQRYLDEGLSLKSQYDTLRQPGRSRLRDLHSELDTAVMMTYGFSSSEDLLTQLLALNQDIDADPSGARGPGSEGLRGARMSRHRIK